MRVMSIRLPKWMILALQDLRRRYGSISEAIRQAIMLLFEQEGVDMNQYIVLSTSVDLPQNKQSRRQIKLQNNAIPSQIYPLVVYLLKYGAKVQKIRSGEYVVRIDGSEYHIIQQSSNRWQVYLGNTWICNANGLARAIIKCVMHNTGTIQIPPRSLAVKRVGEVSTP